MHGFGSTSFKLLATGVVGGCLLVGLTGCTGAINQSANSRQMGLTYYEQGDYGDAAGAFRSAVREDPRDYRSRYYLGKSYERMGSHQLALQSYKSALDAIKLSHEGREDDAFRMVILEGLAGAIVQSTSRDAEISILEQRARSRQSAEDYFLLARTYRIAGDVDSALDSYNRANLLEPNDFYIVKDYGLYLEQLSQEQPAERFLRRAYQMDRNDAEVIAALRRLGITPGPSLRDPSDLARPHIPPGPIPELELERMRAEDVGPAGRRHHPPRDRDMQYNIPSETVEAPRD